MKIAQLTKPSNLSIYSTLFLLVVPSIIWAGLDQRVWPWDQAWYAQVSVELFYRLTHSPLEWFKDMIAAFSIKAPAVSWLGQLFVPFGQIIGSIEVGLLLSIVLTQFTVLLLTYHTILKLTNSRLISLICCLFASSAPLSVALSHQYLVEPLQTTSVSWTILIMVFSPQWKARRVLLHLISAISLGMLAKVTYPLYTFGSILIIVYYIFKKSFQNKSSDQLNSKELSLWSSHKPLYISTFILLTSFLLWYGKNLQNILYFSIQASSGEASLLYGEKASFLYKLHYWLGAFQKSFFAPITLFLMIGVLILALAKSFYDFKKITKTPRLGYFDLTTIVSLLQIILVLACFSFQVNQENRYLLPLLPYLAVLIAWMLKRARQKLLVFFTGFVLVLQLFVVQTQSLGITPEDPNLSYWLYPIDRSSTNKQLLSKLVDTTCKNETEKDRYNIIGLELPWFNANSASYFSAQQQLKKEFRCYYTSLGYAEKDMDRAWARLFDLNINYFATLQPRSQAEAANPLNLVSLPILERIQRSQKFTRETFADDQSHVLLYKKVNP
ncbi:hypothetical protein APA_5361 [Pseudanabaena sp. lw0831]|uniref:hypothetical protein n=1 Tax=Pseudanabaena sp. lw0831 TaxID=1357935 RepID=UPI001914EA40|nr:hypothetical protein [Pseudanabaena sp. lw0831]GBO52271.1 hypothetical protein APA_5361 [Pseudanabaena sp. lw0831]